MPYIFTESSFNGLNNLQKINLLEECGVHLINRTEGIYTIAMFSLYSFYVEVWLNNDTQNVIKAVAFSSFDRLDPFLEGVNIRPIYCLL